MDKISDILRSARDRFYSPLFFSFACSWFLWNWQIIIALFWFDSQGLYKVESMSLFTFIVANTDVYRSLIYPFIVAVGLTIAHPFIRNGIRLLYSWVNTKADSQEDAITKKGSIPMTKFLSLRADYNLRKEELIKIIADESKTIEDLEKERTERLKSQGDVLRLSKVIVDLEAEKKTIADLHTLAVDALKLQVDKNETLEREIEVLSPKVNELQAFKDRVFDVHQMDGKWEHVIYLPEKQQDMVQRLTENFNIFNGNVRTIIDGLEFPAYTIRNFYQDTSSGRIFFIRDAGETYRHSKDAVNLNPGVMFDKSTVFVTELVWQTEDLLSGYENGKVKTSYRKIND